MTLNQYQRVRRSLLTLLVLGVLAVATVAQGQAAFEIHEMIEEVGLVLITVGILGRMWCTLYIGGRKGVEIVASGPYSISRNPLYVFSSIAAGGAGALTGSLTFALAAMLLCAGALCIVILREERFLAAKFGPAFDRYRNTVPRFLPNFRLYRDEAEVTVKPKLVYTTLIDGLVFFAAMPLLEAIEHLQQTGMLSVLIQVP